MNKEDLTFVKDCLRLREDSLRWQLNELNETVSARIQELQATVASLNALLDYIDRALTGESEHESVREND